MGSFTLWGARAALWAGKKTPPKRPAEEPKPSLREALRQARLAGVEKTTAEALVERCYGGNE